MKPSNELPETIEPLMRGAEVYCQSEHTVAYGVDEGPCHKARIMQHRRLHFAGRQPPSIESTELRSASAL